MKLRVVSGRLKRRQITIPLKATDFRPTKDSVREAIASSITTKINSSIVADICCGSGAFGIEMLSRGAAYCDFIDNSRSRCDTLNRTLQSFEIKKNEFSVYLSTVENFIERAKEKYDIIFYDPPYEDDELKELVPKLFKLLNSSGVLIYERRFVKEKYNKKLPLFSESFSLEKKKYGHTELLIWTSCN